MTMVTNQLVNDWVKQMADMTKPDEIVWVDGSKEQLEGIKQIALGTGEMIQLNQEKMPGCLYYRTNPKDVARDEKRTVICSRRQEDAGPTNNWVAPEEMYARLRELFDGSMKGRTMGGGITANAMHEGRVIDVAAYDDGPMAPERSGGVPLLLFNKLCFDGKHTEEDMEKLIAGKGGIYSYLGTKDCREVEKMIDKGDSYAEMIYEAMAFQVAKSIAGLSCALEGKVDVIILTGGVAYSTRLTDNIKKYCGHIAHIEVMPGEREMEALANGTLRMLKGEEVTKEL